MSVSAESGFASVAAVSGPFRRGGALAVLALLAIGLCLVAGCADGCGARGDAEPGAAEEAGAADTAGAADAADAAGSDTAAPSGDTDAADAAQAEQGLPEEGPWRAFAQLASLESRQHGRWVAHMQPASEGTLVIVHRPRGGQVLSRTYLIPDDARAERRIHDLVAEDVAAGPLRGSHPRIVGLGEAGVLQLHILGAMADVGREIPLLHWWIAPEGDEMLGPRAIELPEGVSPAGDVGAARMGDAALVCLSANPQADADRADLIYCGLWTPDDPLRLKGGLRIEGEHLREGALRLDVLAADDTHALLAIWRADAGQVEAAGLIVHRDAGGLRVAAGRDLAGERYPEAGFRLASDPLGAAADGRFVYYLPAVGARHPRVGQLNAQGEQIGARRQAPPYASRQERPLLFWTGREHVLLMDATGRHGERTLLRFTAEGIEMSDYITPLGTLGPAQRARLAGYGEGRFGMMLDDPSGRALLYILDASAVLDPDAPAYPALVNEALQEAFEAQQREKIERAMREQEGAGDGEGAGEGEDVVAGEAED